MRIHFHRHARFTTVYGRRIRNTPNGRRCAKARLAKVSLYWIGPVMISVFR